MDNLMPSYSFSHQFYRHWTNTPETVRSAIVQELTDITTLLKTDTSNQAFAFSIPDLDTHVDELYHAHRAQQAADKARADKTQAEQARLEKEQMDKAQATKAEQDKVAKAKAEKEQADAKAQQEQAEKAQAVKAEQEKATKAKAEEQQTKAIEPKEQTEKQHTVKAAVAEPASEPASEPTSTEQPTTDHNTDNRRSAANDNAGQAALPKKSAPASRGSKDTDAPKATTVLSERHEDLIQELGAHIDDYLSEQMAQLSEDLKSWLRAEISRQLANKSD